MKWNGREIYYNSVWCRVLFLFPASQVIHTTPRRPNINIDNDGCSIERGDAKKTRREQEDSKKKHFS